MRLRFEETMRGWWRTPDGRERHASFNLHAAGRPGFGGFRVVGAIRVDGLKVVGPCSGNVSLTLSRRATIAYDLEFRGDDGRLLGLAGSKDFDPRHPLRSLTTLPFTVVGDDAEPLGRGALRIGGADLVRFLRSFRIDFAK